MIAPVPLYSPLPAPGYTGRTAARATLDLPLHQDGVEPSLSFAPGELHLDIQDAPAGVGGLAAAPGGTLAPHPPAAAHLQPPATSPFRRALIATGFLDPHTESRIGGDPRWSIHSGRRVDGTVARLTEDAGRLAMTEVETRECDEIAELAIGEEIERAFRAQQAAKITT